MAVTGLQAPRPALKARIIQTEEDGMLITLFLPCPLLCIQCKLGVCITGGGCFMHYGDDTLSPRDAPWTLFGYMTEHHQIVAKTHPIGWKNAKP
eukprot:scaffold68386_cov19-Prasinocladus_malaysianus.AAC.1